MSNNERNTITVTN